MSSTVTAYDALPAEVRRPAAAPETLGEEISSGQFAARLPDDRPKVLYLRQDGDGGLVEPGRPPAIDVATV